MKKLITLEQLSAALAKVKTLVKEHIHSAATSSTAGFMSSEDKTKVDKYPEDLSDYPTRTELLQEIEEQIQGAIQKFY